MAGDTFDAGTVYAEARLDRDQFKKDLAALRRDMQQFERQSRVTVRPEFDGRQVATGVEQARAWLDSLHDYKVEIDADVNTGVAQAHIEELSAAIRDLGRQTARPRVEVDPGDAAKKKIKDLKDEMGKSWDKVGSGISSIAGRMPLLIAGVGAFAAGSYAAAGALQVAGSASLGLLVVPGILAAGGAAMAAFKIGTVGLGDAFKAIADGDAKKLGEALAKMSPEARQFVGEVQKLGPAWTATRMDVQNALFNGMAEALNTLATRYMPMLRTELVGIATELRQTALQTSAWLAGSAQIASVQTIMQNTRLSVDQLNPALASILSIFLDVATVGSTFLPQLAEGFANVAANAAKFVSEARASGQLGDWIQRGLDTIASLGGAIISIWNIVRGVVKAAQVDGAGAAASLATVTQKMDDWVNSAKGQQVLIDFFSKARDIATALSPLFIGIAGAAGQMVMAIIPALPPLIQGIADVFAASGPLLGIFSQLAIAILPLVGAGLSALAPILGPLVLIVSGLVTAFKIYTTTVALIETVTKAWALAQAILNGTMALNPIGLVVVAVIALAAALVYAWNNSETFRSIVMAAWAGIQAAAGAAWSFLQTVFAAIVTAVQAVGAAAVWLWQNAIVPAWDGIVAGAQAVGAAFQWLWSNIISPVFDFIATAAKILLAIIVTIVLAPIILAVKAAGAIFTWLWENAIKPAWDAISGAISAAWTGVIQPVLQAIVDFIGGQLTAGWNALRDAVAAVWNAIQTAISTAWNWVLTNILQPIIDFLAGQLAQSFRGWQIIVEAVWSAVSAAIDAAWTFIRDNIWNPIVSFLTAVLGPAFNAARDGIVTAWNAIRDALSAVWNFIRDNIFNPIIDFVRNIVVGAFNAAVDGIRTAWDRIREIVAVPIRFMVNTVYNEGIVPAWNFIAKIVGLGELSKVNLGFATGGIVPGYSPGVDRVPAMLSPGEGVVRPEVTRALGPTWIQQVNTAAMRGGVTGVRRYVSQGGESSAQRFAAGGIAAGQAFARAETGKPYVWGGVGPGGYDCSGFMSAVTNVVLGLAANSRRFATGSFTANSGAGGFVPGTGSAFVIGVSPNTGDGIGHMAGNLGGLNIESSGGKGVSNGGNARGPTDGIFPWQFYLPQVGGTFVPGAGGVDIIGELMKLWAKVTEFLGRIGEFTSTMWGSGAMGMVKNIAQGTLDFLVSKATGGIISAAPSDPGATRTAPGVGGTFDQGGIIPPGTSIVHNRTGRPELAGRLDQWASLIDSSRVNRPGYGANAGANLDQVSMERLAGTMTEIKDLLERRGAGATIHVDGTKGNPVETAQATRLALRMS
jgi:phage-related protein